MFRKVIALLASASILLILAACQPDVIEYNSNSGLDGSRDSASQLLIDHVKSDTIDATIGDHEDWYYIIAQAEGFLTTQLFLDTPTAVKGTFTIHDGFGRQLETVSFDGSSTNINTLPRIEVKAKERYFVALKVTEGKSTYSVEAKFELPPEPEVIPEVVEDKPTRTTKSSCVPADRCKSGQNCCKPKKQEEEVSANAKIVKGSIVVSTPRENGIIDIRISGIGSKTGVKAGMKATLRGLNRNVELYSCKSSSCNGTVKASTEELARYGTVEVVVE